MGGDTHTQIATGLSPVSCNANNGEKLFYLPPQSCCRLLRFTPPSDGMPPIRDWICTFESMLASGVDLAREPISTNVGTLKYLVYNEYRPKLYLNFWDLIPAYYIKLSIQVLNPF